MESEYLAIGEKNQVERLLNEDLSLWHDFGLNSSDIAPWLGWLNVENWFATHLQALCEWATQKAEQGPYSRVILLGMGGSSLAPNVLFNCLPRNENFPELVVLDTTSPSKIASLSYDLDKTLFIVASKSGTTIESIDLMHYFYAKVNALTDRPGAHFIAITDADSWLSNHARENDFSKTFINPTDMGGRYSALHYFGLVPAAICGINIQSLAFEVRQGIKQLKQPKEQRQLLKLVDFIANNAKAGNYKLQLKLSSKLAPLFPWIEQLIAESTGKQGIGVLPVMGTLTKCQLGIVVSMSKSEDQNEDQEQVETAISLQNIQQLGATFFFWQIVVTLVCGKLGINPFDQPDVEQSRIQSKKSIRSEQKLSIRKTIDTPEYLVLGDDNDGKTFAKQLESLVSTLSPDGYLGITAYLPEFPEIEYALGTLCAKIQTQTKRTVTFGFGPRYLHSTGQLHKGGPSCAAFMQIIAQEEDKIPIPSRQYNFKQLHHAQADGDFSILHGLHRPIMRVILKGDKLAALTSLNQQVNAPKVI